MTENPLVSRLTIRAHDLALPPYARDSFEEAISAIQSLEAQNARLRAENETLREANEGIAWALDNRGYPDTAKLLRAASSASLNTEGEDGIEP